MASRRAAREGAVQRWEYLLWELDEREGRTNVDWINSQSGLKAPPMSLVTALAEAGAQGWELVSVYSSTEDFAKYLFKRPKE
jgi:hypothetical protein